MQLFNITITIQAGGRSSRMGTDKGLLHLKGRTMVEHVLDKVSGLGSEIIITTNNLTGYQFLGFPMYPDTIPGAGALQGLVTALKAAKNDLVLVVACDMPCLNKELLEYLISKAQDDDVIIPFWEGHYQPMHAIYRKSSCLPVIEDNLNAGQLKMISFYEKVKVRQVTDEEVSRFDPEGLCFLNINTPQDLARVESLVK